MPNWIRNIQGIKLTADPELTPGDCVAKSRFGMIDARIFTETSKCGPLAEMNQGSPILPTLMKNLRGRIESTTPVVRMGEVVQVTGLVIESVGPNVSLGDICEIRSPA
jgi:hypothetical protein